MLDNQFNGLFDRMVRNWSSETGFWDEEFSKNKRADMWAAFKYTAYEVFKKAVEEIIDADRKKDVFPIQSELRRYVKIYRSSAMYYPDCRACDSSGRVSMYVQFREEEDEGGRTKRVINKKKHWSLETKAELSRWDVWEEGDPKDVKDIAKAMAKTHVFRVDKFKGIIYYRKKDLPWYVYSHYCRCEKGMYLKGVCTPGGLQLSHDEFDELLEAAEEKNDNRIPITA